MREKRADRKAKTGLSECLASCHDQEAWQHASHILVLHPRGPGLNCGTYASLHVLKYVQAFEAHPPPGMYFSIHGTKILSTI